MSVDTLQNLLQKHSATLEKVGFSPVSSRILIYLFSKGDEGSEFDEMVTTLEVSKSAVSNSLKVLQTMKIVSFNTISSTGKRKFYIDFNCLITENDMIERHTSVIDILEDIVKFRNKNDDSSQKIKNIILLNQMLLSETPRVFEKWKKIIADQNS